MWRGCDPLISSHLLPCAIVSASPTRTCKKTAVWIRDLSSVKQRPSTIHSFVLLYFQSEQRGPASVVSIKGNIDNRGLFVLRVALARATMTLFVQHTKAQTTVDNERAVPLISPSLLGAARRLVLSLPSLYFYHLRHDPLNDH
jgi:hypothetical protein